MGIEQLFRTDTHRHYYGPLGGTATVEYHSTDWQLLVAQRWITQTVEDSSDGRKIAHMIRCTVHEGRCQ